MVDVLDIDATYSAEPYGLSKVVGIDEYSLSSATGSNVKWTSYTLLESGGLGRRWWIADFPKIGRHIILPEDSALPLSGDIDPGLTGFAVISSKGNSDLSEGVASLVSFRRNGVLFSAEFFEGKPPLFFKSIPL